MGENAIFTGEEIEFLRQLVRRKVRFIIVGLSAAAFQGAPVVTQDVDIWFENISDPGIGEALKSVGGAFVPSIGENPPMFAGDGVKLFDIVTTVHGIEGFAGELPNTIEVTLGDFSVKALKLDRIIKSKEYLRRQKDMLVLPVLRDALKTIEYLEKKK